MKILLEQAHQGNTIAVGESVEVVKIGRSPSRIFRLRALVNGQDISDYVVSPELKPAEVMESAKRFLIQRPA